MKVDLVPIDSIVGYARNPRRNEKAIYCLIRSISFDLSISPA